MSASVKSCLGITGYIVLFSVITEMLRATHILPSLNRLLYTLFGLEPYITEALFSGIWEMTTGIYTFDGECNRNVAFIISAFLLGWGGLSVHAQTLSVISDCKISLKPYFIGKALHGFISAFFAYIAVNSAFFRETPVFSPFTTNVRNTGTVPFFAIMLIFIFVFCKKGWKKSE